MSDHADKLVRLGDPRLAEQEPPKESGGTLFSSFGIALIHRCISGFSGITLP